MWNSKLREATGGCAQPMGNGVNSGAHIAPRKHVGIFLDIRLETNSRARQEGQITGEI